MIVSFICCYKFRIPFVIISHLIYCVWITEDVLNYIVRKSDKGILIDFTLSRQDLAEMSGTTLYTVSRTLSQWEKDGLVSSQREKVTLLTPHQLVVIAEEMSS